MLARERGVDRLKMMWTLQFNWDHLFWKTTSLTFVKDSYIKYRILGCCWNIDTAADSNAASNLALKSSSVSIEESLCKACHEGGACIVKCILVVVLQRLVRFVRIPQIHTIMVMMMLLLMMMKRTKNTVLPCFSFGSE